MRRPRTRAPRFCAGIAGIAVVTAGVPGAGAELEAANARLKDPRARMALAQAIRGAARQLEDASCRSLLEEFSDASGGPLRAVLDAQASSVTEYLGRVLFYDAPEAACQTTALAVTSAAGSRVIRVCGRRFVRAWTENARHAESVVIHEMLHSLGLGEDPPTSSYITSRVLARCRG
jgi:hypothetical protein